MERTFLSSQILSKRVIANDILEVHLAKPAGFSYLAGQFIQVVVPQGGGQILRSYSLSSVPNQPDLELCIKLLPSGIGSEFFRGSEPGRAVSFSGPQGRFVVGEGAKPCVFVATGVGLAPIMSMISDEVLNKSSDQPIYLLFGVRSHGDVFWTERLEKLANTSPHLTFDLTLSQPTEIWDGLRGRVTHFVDKLPLSADYYLCGSAEMVKDMRGALITRGEPAAAIHFEIF